MKFGQYSTFAFVDVETTGVSASGDRVLEVGIIRVENGKIVKELNSLLDPDSHVPPEITRITGIADSDILNAPHFSDIAEEVEELLQGAVFVAHNARFDYAFLKHEFRRLGLPFNYKTLDTVKLSRKLFPQLPHHNLDALIELLQVKIEHRHRAYDDAKVLFDFLTFAHKTFDEEHLLPIILDFLKTPSLPIQLTKESIEKLPQGPGVYSMYDKTGALLYVGKSVDIQGRVLSHFYNDFDSNTDLLLAREVFRVEATQTGGDLGASILESTMIKTHFPIHNRLLRSHGELIALIQTEKNGYYTVIQKPISQVDPVDHHSILSVFVSKKQLTVNLAEIAKEHKLCMKLLGLEKGKGACFGTQIGLCNGACEGREPSFKYNVRFIETFANSRVPIWPYPGAIGIHEQFEEIEELHIINNWTYVGSVNETSESSIQELLKTPVSFNWDNYKIIRKFIKKHSKENTIINLTLK
jgi:DNA polymerase-3 subunit epsilon